MTAVPLGLHLGPLYFHLYGLGLALATFAAYAYAERRFRQRGYPLWFFGRYIGSLVAVGLIGARLANIATNWGYYAGHPARWFAVWEGGLASFGGLALAVPVAIWLQRRWWPEVRVTDFADTLVVAVIAGWAMGRLLGPQFMVAGGGHPTTAWYGLTYHGQLGKRVPVPLIQGLEDGLLWLGLLWIERRTMRPGTITAVAMVVWGLVRSLDEYWLLGKGGNPGSVGVMVAGIALSIGGLVLWWRGRRVAP